jgi:phosphatidate phosphatase APP1
MVTDNHVKNGKKPTFFKKLKKKILFTLRLTNQPVVKVYNGFGNDQHLIVFGHVYSLSPMPRKKYRSNVITNILSLLRLFMVRTKSDARLKLSWKGTDYFTHSEYDGFYRFEWPGGGNAPGWHPVQVQLIGRNNEVFASGDGLVFVPHVYQYACISDIDDTFLISHSSNLRKRLYVLFTKNAHSRKPFEGVVNHYQLLSRAATDADDSPNPFFYVSSSEWNLYDYIRDFSQKNNMPTGVYLLSQVKKFSEVFKTGQNKHATKFMRIARVLEAYPDQRYILLGDNTQEDPKIYSAVVQHFPGKIHAVYLRHVSQKRRDFALEHIRKMEAAGVQCCYFESSAEAIVHSKKIGLIN